MGGKGLASVAGTGARVVSSSPPDATLSLDQWAPWISAPLVDCTLPELRGPILCASLSFCGTGVAHGEHSICDRREHEFGHRNPVREKTGQRGRQERGTT